MKNLYPAVLLAALVACTPADDSPAEVSGESADAGPVAMSPGGDAEAVRNVVISYHEALARGDSASALALLAPDAVVLESGGMETRAEYESHHLPADMAFSQAVTARREPSEVHVNGDVAWAYGTSESAGEMNGRQINSQGAELMVLTRSTGSWQISAIHWSSRNVPP